MQTKIELFPKLYINKCIIVCKPSACILSFFANTQAVSGLKNQCQNEWTAVEPRSLKSSKTQRSDVPRVLKANLDKFKKPVLEWTVMKTKGCIIGLLDYSQTKSGVKHSNTTEQMYRTKF